MSEFRYRDKRIDYSDCVSECYVLPREWKVTLLGLLGRAGSDL